MRIPRIHVPGLLQTGATLQLPEQAGEHLARVLRLESGHPLILFNGDGSEYDARLAVLSKRSVTAEIGSRRELSRESPLRLTLAQGVARGDKMDWILQKATELGVARIVPVITERTEVRLDEDRAGKRLAHWSQVIASACEQCGRNELPQILPPQKLMHWCAGLTETDSTARFALLPEADVGPRDIGRLEQGALLLVGPEGGLSDHDIAIARNAKFRGLRLGPRILRTETAGIAALAALQAIAGDFA
ncbi:16S rRNA (uracil1498-N3)-methyltransferase [Tahibacter aquaticus]|jgi:16S rRNA (uracil1498-N3)-methyltransferase|uniref:Ribosomal RNA small subunit methyltransferase E n=1 Tax=Tahibacter aquaticus TaxID=520092 RepID=A0A4R6YPN3_9GAMM|nr:16S rRNA (uracil(1498)-N(3))-methyltransferase [Tahibacter aquaticus]TDR39732.1 16S rRNA (uracil1498-N3)-methyltransferase [Tahibacter aquaticus]